LEAQTGGRHDEAALLYRQCLDAGGGGAWAHANLGLAYRTLGRIGDARGELREARRLDPQLKLPLDPETAEP
jgi:hypothetical protein